VIVYIVIVIVYIVIVYIVGHDVSTSTWCDLGTLDRVANDTELSSSHNIKKNDF
jgi:hypothetical protein